MITLKERFANPSPDSETYLAWAEDFLRTIHTGEYNNERIPTSSLNDVEQVFGDDEVLKKVFRVSEFRQDVVDMLEKRGFNYLTKLGGYRILYNAKLDMIAAYMDTAIYFGRAADRVKTL